MQKFSTWQQFPAYAQTISHYMARVARLCTNNISVHGNSCQSMHKQYLSTWQQLSVYAETTSRYMARVVRLCRNNTSVHGNSCQAMHKQYLTATELLPLAPLSRNTTQELFLSNSSINKNMSDNVAITYLTIKELHRKNFLSALIFRECF